MADAEGRDQDRRAGSVDAEDGELVLAPRSPRAAVPAWPRTRRGRLPCTRPSASPGCAERLRDSRKHPVQPRRIRRTRAVAWTDLLPTRANTNIGGNNDFSTHLRGEEASWRGGPRDRRQRSVRGVGVRAPERVSWRPRRLHVRGGGCRSTERRMPLVRAHGASTAKTITTCENSKGALRVIKSNGRCKRGEKKLVWAIAGQPQNMTRFGATEEASFEPKAVKLFAAGGDAYTFTCQFLLFISVGEMQAAGAAATSYGQAAFTRPTGQESLEADPKSAAIVEPIGAKAVTIADASTVGVNGASSSEDIGVWSLSVQDAKSRPGSTPRSTAHKQASAK